MFKRRSSVWARRADRPPLRGRHQACRCEATALGSKMCLSTKLYNPLLRRRSTHKNPRN